MAKISPVSSKYVIHATINIEGVVDRPDIIGAVFGQTEGLLGADLELRELQRSGRIGRIEVNTETRAGKTSGTIIIPSSLDKAETVIVGASLEIIQRIGPCNAKVKVDKIEDVRISKREAVVSRAKELLRELMEGSMPDSQELADEVAYSVRVMEATEYGTERLSAGPTIDESDEIVVVEGRADVLNLLKHGFKNVIALNGTGVPKTIVELSKKKTITVFVDGDRGGDLIIKGLLDAAEIDFVAKAPDGKEVEEITKKEIHKALRGRISAEQAEMELTNKKPEPRTSLRPQQRAAPAQRTAPQRSSAPQARRPYQAAAPRRVAVSESEKKAFKEMLEDLIGTKGAYILDNKLNILGKVPITELESTIKSLGSGIYAVVLDGSVDKPLIGVAERTSVKHIIGSDSKVKPQETRINILTVNQL